MEESFQKGIEKKKLSISGGFSLEGNLKDYSLLEIEGSGDITGDVSVEVLEVSGSMKCKDLEFEQGEISGSVKADSLTGNKLEINGSLKAGKVNVKEIEINGELKASEINAEKVLVGKKSRVVGTIVCNNLDLKKGAEVDSVIAKDVNVGVGSSVDNLECYTCKIEPKAEVEFLKYVTSAQIDPEAKVRHSAKVDRISKDFDQAK